MLMIKLVFILRKSVNCSVNFFSNQNVNSATVLNGRRELIVKLNRLLVMRAAGCRTDTESLSGAEDLWPVLGSWTSVRLVQARSKHVYLPCFLLYILSDCSALL